MKVLFLCTGNYYRSRLAEEALRGYSAAQDIKLVSDSAGLGIIPNPINIGPMRLEAVNYLKNSGFRSIGMNRFPKKCTVFDLESSDIVIGMNEPEHKQMFDEQFPGIAANRVRYWHVPDMDEDPGFLSPDLIDRNVRFLLKEIARINLHNSR
jgi:protein-tyrosine phosphatase